MSNPFAVARSKEQNDDFYSQPFFRCGRVIAKKRNKINDAS